MANFTQPSAFTFNNVDQVDIPDISANDMKVYLDSRAKELRDYLIAFLAEAAASTDGASGADKIGMTAITETGAAATIQSIVEALIVRLKAVVDGVSGADLIGATAIAGFEGTTVQAILEANKTALDTTNANLNEHQADDVKHAPDSIGTAGQLLAVNAGASATEWKNIPDSSDTAKGIVELATDAEVTAGTSTTLAVTPAGAKVELNKRAVVLQSMYVGDGSTSKTIAVGFTPKIVFVFEVTEIFFVTSTKVYNIDGVYNPASVIQANGFKVSVTGVNTNQNGATYNYIAIG